MYYSVTDVKALPDYRLSLSFEDGKRGTFDMSAYLDMPIFRPLKAAQLFNLAFADHGTVAWPGGIDIAPERLWTDCQPVQLDSRAD